MKKVAGIFGLLVVIVVVTTYYNRNFLTPDNLRNVARWTGLVAVMAIGEAFVIITGGIDLSVGSVVGLSGVVLPMLLIRYELPVGAAVPIVLAMSAAIGMAHGLLITRLRLQPFIVTLCGLFIYRGIARYITGDATQGFGVGFDGLKYLANGLPFSIPVPVVGAVPVPMPFLIMAGIAVIAAVYLNLTIYGRYLLALGRNEQAARLSGINTNRMIVVAYVLCATLAGAAGMLFALDLNSVQPSNHGNFYELYAIAGAVLGGCSLRGGEGSILGVIIGTAIMRVLYNAINLLGIATQLEYAVIGTVILLGVVADEVIRRIAARTRRARSLAHAETGERTG